GRAARRRRGRGARRELQGDLGAVDRHHLVALDSARDDRAGAPVTVDGTRQAEDASGNDADRGRWLNRGVGGIGSASFFADLGHEVPTALLPSFLTSTLGAPAAALGLIEGIADGCAGVAKVAGGALADDPVRRRRTAVGGYTATAVLSSLV